MERFPMIPVLMAALAVAASPAHGGDMLAPGDVFPSFELEAQDGSRIGSGALAGTTYLLFFYPKADTPGCTKEACRLRDSWADLREMGVKVLGVSYDSPEANRRFAEKHRLPFRLLSDVNKRVRKLFGVPGDLLGLLPGRVTYIVDKTGTVRHVFNSQFNAEKHVSESLEVLKSLT
jgi:peroxiredoxin Q/BCP